MTRPPTSQVKSTMTVAPTQNRFKLDQSRRAKWKSRVKRYHVEILLLTKITTLGRRKLPFHVAGARTGHARPRFFWPEPFWPRRWPASLSTVAFADSSATRTEARSRKRKSRWWILVDQATKISRVTYSSDDGEYSFNQVIPSTYSLEAEASGFKRVERKDVPITTQPQIALDLGLQVGDVSQTVEVSAEVPLIETSNAQQGQAFSHEKLSQLPNFGRNPFGMGRLSQNVTPVGNPATNNMQTQSATALTSVAGGMLWQNSYIIDGVPSTAWFGLPLILPSLEAVAEMKVQVNHYDSEMGRTGGGVFNTILRSGTNDLHGSVYGHIRRTGMNANLYFNNAAGRPLSPNADDMGRQPRRSRLHSKGL